MLDYSNPIDTKWFNALFYISTISILAVLLSLTRKYISSPSHLNHASKNPKTKNDPLNFASITPLHGSPLTHPPDWPRYWKPGKFQMTMALRKLDINHWFNYDNLFESEHAAKLAMVNSPDPKNYVDYLDGIDDAVVELLDTVVAYITRRFPDVFRADGEYVYIDHLREKYRIREPYDLHPLAVAGLLVMDDLYVLKRGVGNLYYLRGAFLACPTGWKLQQRLGWPLHQIHNPVPLWKEKLRKSMERFFLNLQPSKPIQRNNLFIQPGGGLFHIVPFQEQPRCTSIEQVHLRTELQSLSRLPRSQAIIFTVRTYLVPITELSKEPEQLEALWDHVHSWPEDVAEYKCYPLWGDVFEEFCREFLGKENPGYSTKSDNN